MKSLCHSDFNVHLMSTCPTARWKTTTASHPASLVLRETRCSFNAETNILNCERSEDVSNYFNTLVWAKTVSVAELHLRTNCLPKCSYTEYQVQHSVFSPSWNPIKSDYESWNCRSQKDLRSTLIGGATGSRQFTSLCDQELWSCKRSTLSMTFRW